MPQAKQRNTTQRGLGWKHQKRRAGLITNHDDGKPCWWCGRPMFRDRRRNFDYDPTSTDPASGSLAADHTHARAHGGHTADRLLHGLCNKERGDGTHDDQRPALLKLRGGHPANSLTWG